MSELSPHITLAILTRNRPELLETALRAASSAAVKPDDILVSDDSDDDCVSKTMAVVGEFPGVRYTSGPRRGLGANENHIVSNLVTDAEWVVFNGDDTEVTTQFFAELKTAIRRHAPLRRIPTGTELRNGQLIRPNRLDFLGYQSLPYADYSPGSEVQTVVVQATAFPVSALRQVRWLEVSLYGYDEVDMAHKVRRLGWTFAFEPAITLRHNQAEAGRAAYPHSLHIARIYFRLRSFTSYDRRPLSAAAFLIVAPVHLLGVYLKRRDWRGAICVPSLVWTALGEWRRSLCGDWRLA